jgi:dipeptidase E
MKLFLTSAGIAPEIGDQFLKLLGKDPKGLKLVFVPTAADPENDEWFLRFVEKDKENLAKFGFDLQIVDLKNETEFSLENKFVVAEIVYVEGGNTFYLLDWVRKSGFDKVVKRFLERGGIYVGVSAGSIIAGLNIESANWEPPDRNISGLKDLTAMNLVNFVITPHYCSEFSNAVGESASKADYSTVALTDKQAVLVDGGKIEIIGSGEKIIFNSKKFLADNLRRVFEANKDKRIAVVGTTCTGKTTFIELMEGCFDMDALVFPKLTKEEADYVCQIPWTPEIGNTMNRLAKERVVIEAGKPVFGTVVLDCDLVVYLKISDWLLRQRTGLRGVDFNDAKNMQNQIEKEIRESGKPVVEFFVG